MEQQQGHHPRRREPGAAAGEHHPGGVTPEQSARRGAAGCRGRGGRGGKGGREGGEGGGGLASGGAVLQGLVCVCVCVSVCEACVLCFVRFRRASFVLCALCGKVDVVVGSLSPCKVPVDTLQVACVVGGRI